MFDKLFTPITIKDMTLRNRIIMPAMGTRFTVKLAADAAYRTRLTYETMTAWIYTPKSADGITFAADGQATITVEQFELNL